MRSIAFWLSLLMIFVIPWENMITTGSSVTTGAKLVGLVVAAFWVATVAVTGRFRKPHPFHIVVGLYLIWNAFTLFWTVDVGLTTSRLQTYFQLAAMVFILWDLYETSAKLLAGLQAYILGAYVAVGGTLYNYGLDAGRNSLRFAAGGFNVNDLGIILALGIPVAWYLIVSVSSRERPYLLTLLNYAYLPAAVLAILLTASRAALLATVPGLLFIIWSLRRLSVIQRMLVFSASVLALSVFQEIVPQPSILRLTTIASSDGFDALGGRLDIWSEGLAVFSEHPLVGVGSGAFRAATELGRSAHNFALSLLVELGIIGFGIFVFILVMAFYYARRQPKLRSQLWLTFLLVWMLGAATHNWEHRKQTWLFLSFVFVGAGLAAKLKDPEALHPEPGPRIVMRSDEDFYVEATG